MSNAEANDRMLREDVDGVIRAGLSPETEQRLGLLGQDVFEVVLRLAAEVARLEVEVGERIECGQCAGPMSLNPHPQAGEPATILEVGAMWVCIPCCVRGRHGWSGRAYKAEAEVADWRAGAVRAASEDCAGENHCSCVAVLRRVGGMCREALTDAEADVERLKAAWLSLQNEVQVMQDIRRSPGGQQAGVHPYVAVPPSVLNDLARRCRAALGGAR